MVLTIVSALLGLAIVALVVLVALAGWAGEVPKLQRLALCAIAGGVMWAGPGRARAGHVGLGDVLFLAGVLAYGLAVYGRQLLVHADRLDGLTDGRVRLFVVGGAAGADVARDARRVEAAVQQAFRGRRLPGRR